MNSLQHISDRYTKQTQEIFSLQEYIELAKTDKGCYASATERLLKAIGEPELVETMSDPRLARIFSNRIIPVYNSFKDFYGLEDVISKIVSFLKHAAQGLEESKQILYLLGPVGGGKSSIAEKLKELMEKEPIYVLAVNKFTEMGDFQNEIILSPIFESPLGLFSPEDSELLNIPKRYLKQVFSPWANKRLNQFDGDITKFRVVKLYPSQINQIALSKTEPGDENNQDISALVGKVDIRKLALFEQQDPDCYSYSGGLCKANQGLLEFVEMFKAPIKVLHPLLTATQEGLYNGTEAIGGLPFNGLILAHSNESEWQSFKNNKNNEAFIDRVSVVKIPYCLRINDEVNIYKKLLLNSSISTAACANETLEILSKLCVFTRLKTVENSSMYSKILVYNGQNMKEEDPQAKVLEEYTKDAGIDEGFSGLSTRDAYKILSRTLNYDPSEVAANPVHLFVVLEDYLKHTVLNPDRLNTYSAFIQKELFKRYYQFVEKEIKTAYLESYAQYGQNMFERYIKYSDMWLQDQDYRDPNTGQLLNKKALDEELSAVEKPAGISNPKEFRNDIVSWTMRYQVSHNGKLPSWQAYNRIKEVLEKKMFLSMDEILPIISTGGQSNKEDLRKHHEFIERMVERGYTQKQVKLIVEWYIRHLRSA